VDAGHLGGRVVPVLVDAGHQVISPFHDLVFGGMVRNITGAAARERPRTGQPAREEPPPGPSGVMAGKIVLITRLPGGWWPSRWS
jgi:hypothetical protein